MNWIVGGATINDRMRRRRMDEIGKDELNNRRSYYKGKDEKEKDGWETKDELNNRSSYYKGQDKKEKDGWETKGWIEWSEKNRWRVFNALYLFTLTGSEGSHRLSLQIHTDIQHSYLSTLSAFSLSFSLSSCNCKPSPPPPFHPFTISFTLLRICRHWTLFPNVWPDC